MRPAAPADPPALGRLGAVLVRTHHDFDPARVLAATPNTESAYAAFLRAQLQESAALVVVAARHGVGRALLDATLAALRERSAPLLATPSL